MINIIHNPSRDASHGEFYVELVKTDFGDDAPPRDLWSRVGYWCDRKHLEGIVSTAQRELDRATVTLRTTQIGVNTFDANGAPDMVVYTADNYHVTPSGILMISAGKVVIAQYPPGKWVTANAVGKTGSAVA